MTDEKKLMKEYIADHLSPTELFYLFDDFACNKAKHIWQSAIRRTDDFNDYYEADDVVFLDLTDYDPAHAYFTDCCGDLHSSDMPDELIEEDSWDELLDMINAGETFGFTAIADMIA